MSLKFFACGDVVNSTGNLDWLCAELKSVIRAVDFSIANFEAPIDFESKVSIAKAGPHICQNSNSVYCLKEAGFTHVSLANNHIYDYGEEGFVGSVEALRREGIEFVGAGEHFSESYKPKIIEKNGLNVALFSACENEFGCHYDSALRRAGYAWLFHPDLEDQVKEVKKTADYVVLIAHAGVENIPIPIKEWRDRYKRLCDLGVDVVIGHHPHVPQGYERYNEGYIFYSLGNFYFDTPAFIDRSDDSYSVLLSFDKGSPIGVDFIFHKKIDRKVTLVQPKDVSFELGELNSLLGEGYRQLNDKYSLKLYDDYYREYYQSSVGGDGFKGRLKAIVKLMLGREDKSHVNKGLLLLHNIRIDSHRFTVQRALSLRYER